MDKEKKSEIHITNNFNAPIGQHIDHVDTINFRMDGDGTFHFGMVENVNEGTHDTELVRRLTPFFKTEEEAKKFPARIEGMKDKDITRLVNQLAEKGVFADSAKPTDLWKVLHDLGRYTATDRNFCDQVTFKKKRE